MKLEDYVFAETDDACAICGIRGPEKLTVHHIDHNESNNVYDNMIVLCHNCHHQYHNGKGLSRPQIEERKRHLIEKTLTQYGVNALKIADRNPIGVVAMPFLLYHLVDLGYMTKEQVLSTFSGQQGGEVETEARFAITAEGSRLIEQWL